MSKNLKELFDPKSIVVIGASADRNKVGYALMSNLLNGAKRDIYPVNLSDSEVFGIKVHKSVKDIGSSIDLAVIAVQASIVPNILAECGEKGIQFAIIISAGFREIGAQGLELENKIMEIAKKYNISLLGPNCLGIIDTMSDLDVSFANKKPLTGHIAFLSQSGALGTAVLDKANSEGIGFSKFISLGNEADLNELTFLEYLKDDKDTKAILIYLEKLSNGHEFMEICKEISKIKPIVVLKAGRSSRGARAVMSHTGSLAPEDAIFTSACRQAGIIVVESIREFFNMAKLFQLGIMKPLQNLVVLTNAGGPGVIISDLIDLSKSLSLVELDADTKEKLKSVLPIMASVENPVDIIGDALAKRYADSLDILVKEKNIDAILTILTPQMMTEVSETAHLILKYQEFKPIIPIFIGGPSIEEGLNILNKHGLCNFSFPKDAVEALDNLAQGYKKTLTKEISNKTDHHSSDRMLSFRESFELLDKYGIRIPGILLKEKSEISEAMGKLNSAPYVLKVMSPEIIHKSDSGAVSLNINTLEDAERGWDTISNNVKEKVPNAHIEGILLQSMSHGKETIIGMKRDPLFGPTIIFGLGGIFTEILKDTTMRIAPINEKMAKEMINDIHSHQILTGARGEKSVDIDSLAEIIVKISKLSIENPNITEIDLNPVVVSQNDCKVVDARVIVE